MICQIRVGPRERVDRWVDKENLYKVSSRRIKWCRAVFSLQQGTPGRAEQFGIRQVNWTRSVLYSGPKKPLAGGRSAKPEGNLSLGNATDEANEICR